jgi:FkbM family methyltransferase
MFPLTTKLPYGSDWLFDIQRFSGTKRARYIVDAGANVGQTAKIMSLYFPKASIYSFEPVASTYRQLTLELGKSRNVECIPKALGASRGREIIRLRKNTELNTLAKGNAPGTDLTGEEEEIEIVTLDEFCSSRGIPHLDILKMDVQGWELNILRGGSDLIKNRRIHYVYSEVGFKAGDAEMQHFSELDSFMEGKGFMISGFYESFRWGEHREFLGFCNVLYTDPRFAAG